jgi:hypothetical protein
MSLVLPQRRMNVNRVTLSAFGTTGVLLAASLTMLAMVSALVTFDAWPTRGGGATANTVAIQQAPAPRVVRAVRNPRPAAGSAARAGTGGGSTAGGAAAAGAAGGAGGGGVGGPGGAGGPGGPSGSSPVPSGPVPQVPDAPPGEGDPGIGSPGPGPATTPDPVTTVHTVACGTVSDLGAGGAAGC